MNNQTRNHLNLQKHIADQGHIIRVRNAEIAALRKRAEKAEQERDEARADLAEYVQAQALRTQPRPLAPDAIIDEMVERARSAYWGPTYGGSVDERVRAILTAALAPARPEGAEDWEDWLIEAMPHESMPDEDIALLADRIAQRLNEERS